MKKLLLIGIFLLVGCNKEDGKKDSYSSLPSLTPEQVVKLHKFCEKQPNYNNSYIVSRDGQAKGVICKFKDSDKKMGVPDYYAWDADQLKQKLEKEK